jgi:hypothetical protein
MRSQEDRHVMRWTFRRWATAAVAALLFLGLVGVPTGIVSTTLYSRMTPVTWWDYPIWLGTGLLAGLIVATYVRTPVPGPGLGTNVAGGGLLSAFAVGCPICNKLVVAVLGVSGALNIWAPLQPLLGLGTVGLLGWALVKRLRGERACSVASGPVTASAGALPGA